MALTQIKLAAMAANSIDSDQYIDASIDNAHIGDDQVDGSKLTDNIDIAGTLDVTGAATFDSTGTFTGNVQVGTASTAGTYVRVQRSDAGNVFSGNNASGNTVEITADGAATFAGNVDIAGYIKKNTSAGALCTYIGDTYLRVYSSPSSLDDYKISLENTGAATFKGAVISGESGGDYAFGLVNPASTSSNAGGLYQGNTGASDLYLKTAWGGSSTISLYGSTGDATFAGSVKIGGTAAANEMDEYEEGTFTPTMYGSTGSAGTAADLHPAGAYTKIGRLVHVRFQIVKTNLGSWTGSLRFGGLPFASVVDSAGSLSMYPSGNVDAAMRGIQIPGGQSYCQIMSGAKLDAVAPYSEVVTGYYLQASITYYI